MVKNLASQSAKDSSYRQNLFLFFRKKKVEELYHYEHAQSLKNYRISLMALFVVWLLFQLYDQVQMKEVGILIISLFRIHFDFKMEKKQAFKWFSFFVNILTLVLSLMILSSLSLEKELDQIYYHALALSFHYLLLPSLPINVALASCIFFYYKDTPLAQNTHWHFIALYILNKRSRDMFILMDGLRKQQKTYLLMIENSPNPIFVIDMHQRIHYYNVQARQILERTFKNFAERPSFGVNVMMLFDENFHEKLNQAIFDCTLKHETTKLFQIPLISKTEFLSPLLEAHSSTLSPQNLSLSKSLIKPDFLKTHQSSQFLRHCNFYNISIQSTFWKGGHFFLLTLENQEKNNRIYELEESYLTFISSMLVESLDLMEKDYQKWNNFQVIKTIKESDLKDLASIVVECNRIKSLVSTLKNINQLALEHIEKNPHKFNIKNTLVQCMELISIKAIEKKFELLLKFEDSFPEYVYGEYENFKQLIHCVLRIINLSPLSSQKKASKFVLFAKLNKYSEEGRFILTFNFEAESNELLHAFYQELCESYKPQNPFNFEYILEHSNWDLDQLALIPLLRLLTAEVWAEKTEEKSILSIEISFDTSDLHLGSSVDKSNSHSSPSANLLNKKPLQLSFCRISSNVNNVIWREKPQAALVASRQPQPLPHKKKQGHIDFMKTSMKGCLISQLERDKENKERERERDSSLVPPSSFKPQSLSANNNLSITKGTPSFEFIKKEQDEQNNFLASPSWKEEKESKGERKGSRDVKEFQKLEQKQSGGTNSKEGVRLQEKNEDESKGKPCISNFGPMSPLNIMNHREARNIRQDVIYPQFGSKAKNDMPFSQISEKEIESSRRSSAKDIKMIETEKNGKRKDIAQIMNESSVIIIPEKIVETIDLLKAKFKGEFERMIYVALEEIAKKHMPTRVRFPDENKSIKRNFSELQLNFSEKLMIDSPKSSLIENKKKKKKKEKIEKNPKSWKKFSCRLNISKSLAKKLHKSSFMSEGGSLSFDLQSATKLKKATTKNSILISSALGPSFEEMSCFACQSITHRRKWTLNFLKPKEISNEINVLIVAKVKSEVEKEIRDATYLRSLLNKRSVSLRIKVFYVEGFDQVEGYLKMKGERNEKFTYVFLEESSQWREIGLTVTKYREYEKNIMNGWKSHLIIIGNNEGNLQMIKEEYPEIRDVLELDGNDEDWNKLNKIFLEGRN